MRPKPTCHVIDVEFGKTTGRGARGFVRAVESWGASVPLTAVPSFRTMEPMAKRILMLVGDYVEDYEAMVPFQILGTMGHVVDTASPGKRAGERVITAIHDFEGEQTYSEKRGHYFAVTATWDELSFSDYDALVLPGGRAPEFLRLNPRVIECVRHFFQRGLPVAAICHAAQILAAADVLSGRHCSAYPAVRPDVERAGATYVEASPQFDNAHTDDNLVTAPAWPAHPAWMRQFLALLDRPD